MTLMLGLRALIDCTMCLMSLMVPRVLEAWVRVTREVLASMSCGSWVSSR